MVGHRVLTVLNGFDPADLPGTALHRTRSELNGTPLDLVFGGYWYGRNGPGILLDALARVGPDIATLTIVGGFPRRSLHGSSGSRAMCRTMKRPPAGATCTNVSPARTLR